MIIHARKTVGTGGFLPGVAACGSDSHRTDEDSKVTCPHCRELLQSVEASFPSDGVLVGRQNFDRLSGEAEEAEVQAGPAKAVAHFAKKCDACGCCLLCGADEPETLAAHYVEEEGQLRWVGCPYGWRAENGTCACSAVAL